MRAMPSCVLRAAGRDLDVDTVLAGQPLLKPDALWHAGERDEQGRAHPGSGFVLWVADEPDWRTVLDRTLERLDLLRGLLEDVKSRAGMLEVEFTLDAGRPDVPPTITLPPGPLRRIGEHGVTVRVTAVVR
jgi:hypothetical protein